MLRWKKRIRQLTYLLMDLISIMVAFILAEVVFMDFQSGETSLSGLERLSVLMVLTLFLITMFLMFNLYAATVEAYGRISMFIAIKMFVSLGVATLLLGSFMFFMKVDLSRLFLLDLVSTLIVVFALNRTVLKRLSFTDQKDYKHNKNILVIGQSRRGRAYIDEIKKHNYLNMNIIGYISIKEPNAYDDVKHIGDLSDLRQIVHDYVIDEIAVARPLSYDSNLAPNLNMCQNMGITVTMLLDIHDTETTKAQVAMVGDLPVLKFHTVSLNESQLFAKRILDVAGSLIGMFFFGIAYIILGPLIKLESPGPVIFKQDRVGQNGRIFQVWKFRSMGIDAEARKEALLANNEMSGHMFKITNDPRITRIGAFIRKTSLDELPQFYNVLRGDMSLVGTRPPTVSEVKDYENHHHRRISIVPGITGNWQVSGRSDIEDFEEVVRLDSEYINNWSVWLDIKILLKTFLVVFARKGSR